MDNNAKNYFDIGLEYYELGEYDKALNSFNKAVEIDDEHISEYFRRI